ncbi:WAT1-related protein [Dichanthelium oligosanthes]|uniref:WAT1-related protein n=1 Tax=Dichanthelium oligosanthes TaxID=888268 RepID=A0A1E5VL47_9POAL|nr:WAT1-related protein [Dichanthelium oligosanthes]
MGNRAAFVVAFLLRAIYGGMQIVTKNAFDEGMSTTVFVFYRHLTAILFLVPVAFVLERLETLNLKRFHGIAKVCGILCSLAGVIVLAFYQGPAMKSFNRHHLLHHKSNFHGGVTAHPKRTWILGIFLTTLSTTSWALWTVLQGPMLEAYPSKLLNTTLQMIFATIQCFFIALVAERDFAKWRLGLDARLIAVIYSGILVSGVAYYMQVWVIDKSGPVFLAMTMPITLLVTIILSLFLGEAVTLGRHVTAILLLVPVAFVLERIEYLNVKRFQGIVEVTGIVFCVAGVIVLAFYQGPEMKSFNHHRLLHHTSNSHATISAHPGFFIALVAERDFSRWKLKLDISLIAVLYSGILISGVGYYMQVWVIDKSGPVFLVMTMPITLLVTILLSSFLGEAVTLGSILGGVVMVGGLYCVLWAKKTEQVAVSKDQMAAPVRATQV